MGGIEIGHAVAVAGGVLLSAFGPPLVKGAATGLRRLAAAIDAAVDGGEPDS